MSQSKFPPKNQSVTNKIHFRTKVKKDKVQNASDFVPLSMNVYTIDNPKNLIFMRKKQRSKITSKQFKTVQKRILRSQLHHYRKKSLSLEKYMSKEDEFSFSDRKMVFGDHPENSSKIRSPQLIESKNFSVSIPDVKKSQKSIESTSPKKINEMDRYIASKEIQNSSHSKRPPQRLKLSTSIKKQKKIAFPTIMVQRAKKNQKKIIHLSELMNFEEKDKLDGWNLNSPFEENERKIDIIQYTKKSATSVAPYLQKKKIK